MGISAVVTTIIGIVGTKYIAWELGAEGVGIQSLLVNTIGFLTGLFGFSLAQSGTQYIAKYAKKPDHSVTSVIATVTLVSRWQALVALLLVAISSYVFSLNKYSDLLDQWTGLWMAFGAASSILLAGYQAQINGFRRIKSLAALNTSMALFGTVITCICVYTFGLRGLSSVLIAPYLCGLLLCTLIVKRRDKLSVHTVSSGQHVRQLLSIGWVLTIGVIAVQSTQLILRAWLEYNHGIDTVGYFHAAWLIGMTYIGFILTAMLAEYYPRLSQLADIETQINTSVNRQIELCLIVILPLIVLGTLFAKTIVEILYTKDFGASEQLLRYLLIGDLFKVTSWSIAIGLLVRECKIHYLMGELIWNFLFLLTSVMLYPKLELASIGLSYILAYLCYFLWTIYALNRSTRFSLSRKVQNLMLYSILTVFLLITSHQYLINTPVISALLIIFTLLYSAKALFQMLNSSTQ